MSAVAIELIERPAPLAVMMEQAEDFLRNSQAENTTIAYRSDFERFKTWCESHGVSALPATPDTISLYISHLASTPVLSKTGKVLRGNYKTSTIERRIASISVAHKTAGYDSPCRSDIVHKMLKGIRRTIGVEKHQKAALRVSHIRQIVDCLPDTLQGKRDRALLLLGHSGAFRRSELVALNVDDLEFSMQGVVVRIRKSKTNQEGKPEEAAIGPGIRERTCPIRALHAWLDAAGITEGPVFRAINRHGQMQGRLSGKALAMIVKRLATDLGFDPDDIGGHSLRAGMVTDLCGKDVPEYRIMGVTRHRNPAMIRQYYRETNRFAFNHVAAVGY